MTDLAIFLISIFILILKLKNFREDPKGLQDIKICELKFPRISLYEFNRTENERDGGGGERERGPLS